MGPGRTGHDSSQGRPTLSAAVCSPEAPVAGALTLERPGPPRSTLFALTVEYVPGVVCESVSLAFDEQLVLDKVSFIVPKGRMTIVLGASGSGKSVALKLILGLLRPDAGQILVNGHRIDRMSEQELLRVRGD